MILTRTFTRSMSRCRPYPARLLTLHRKQAVSTQTQELEALERRLREAEDRLKQAKTNSPPRRKDSSRRSPLEGVFPTQDKALVNGPASPLAQRNAQVSGNTAGARPGSPSSHTSADHVLVERPHSSQRVEAEKA